MFRLKKDSIFDYKFYPQDEIDFVMVNDLAEEIVAECTKEYFEGKFYIYTDIKKIEMEKIKEQENKLKTLFNDEIKKHVEKNKLKNISSVDLKDIFLKKNTNWKKLNGENRKIALIGRDFSSGTRIVFEKYLHSSGKINYDIELENNGKVKYKLQNDEDSIGYLSFSAVDDSLNVLSIDGIEPSFENIKNSKYHIIHPLLQITKKGVKDPIIDAWFSFVFSDKGAAIIKQNRFIPVPKN